MLSCVICGVAASMGALCPAHAREIATCRQLTSEQILSSDRPRSPGRDAARTPAAWQPTAWLIDQWGCTHAVHAPAVIGRSHGHASIAILHPSVSLRHARLDYHDGRWSMTDLGSLNGSFCNDRRRRETVIRPGDRVGFGQVQFYFTVAFVPRITQTERPGQTQRLDDDATTRTIFVQAADGRIMEVVERQEGGAGMISDQVVHFGKLEFGLLGSLIDRRQKHGDPDLCFITWQELSQTLMFRSPTPDSENVRELVRRVRRKLRKADFPDIIESRQGSGYRLAGTVLAVDLAIRGE